MAKKKLTLTAFRSNPEAVIDNVFGDGGLLGKHVANFRSSAEQVAYGRLVARAAARGLDADEAGRLTLLDAATGIGKTLPYAVVGLLAAVLTGKRFMVATNTRALMHQLVGKDGHIAASIVEELAGRRPTFAPRRSRSGFASPGRSRAYAESIKGAKPDHAAALVALADFTETALDRVADGDTSGVVADLDGLPESFAAENPAAWELVCELPVEKWRLAAGGTNEDDALWKCYGDAARMADGIVVTHAAALIDQSLHGRILDACDADGNARGYALVVIDEAHALERAAELAFQTKRSVGEIFREACVVRDRLAPEWFPKNARHRDETARLADKAAAKAEILVEKLRTDVKTRSASEDRIDVGGFEDWIPAFRSALQSVRTLSRHLSTFQGDSIDDAAREWDARMRDMDFFWESVKTRRKAAKIAAAKKDAASVNRPSGLFRPRIVLTPKREEPSFQVVPARGQRVISRLWWRGKATGDEEGRKERPIRADAVIFTSATLGYPGKTGWESFAAMTWTLGIDEWDQHLVNRDLSQSLEPKKFGEAKFVFPHPTAPLPSSGDGEGGLSSESASYAAIGIAFSARLPNTKNGTCRILVLTTNSVDPQRIFERLPNELKDRCVVRRQGMGMQDCIRAFKERDNAILIAYGVWEGIDLPGLVDHLVVTRLPFRPPPGEDEETTNEFGGNLLFMLRTLRQGLGRAIRMWNDSTTYVFTDPRIGLPEAVFMREFVVPHEKSSPIYLRAIPTRFRRSMDAGTLLPEFKRPKTKRTQRETDPA
jgi:ATP-dependent DNA helicase DinG